MSAQPLLAFTKALFSACAAPANCSGQQAIMALLRHASIFRAPLSSPQAPSAQPKRHSLRHQHSRLHSPAAVQAFPNRDAAQTPPQGHVNSDRATASAHTSTSAQPALPQASPQYRGAPARGRRRVARAGGLAARPFIPTAQQLSTPASQSAAVVSAAYTAAQVSVTAQYGTSASKNSVAEAAGKDKKATKAPVLLLDGNAVALRPYFAMFRNGLSSAKGVPTSATSGVLTTLKTVASIIQPSAIVVAADGGKSFRKEMGARLEQLAKCEAMTDTQFIELCGVIKERLSQGTWPLSSTEQCEELKTLVPEACRPVLEVRAEYGYKAGRKSLGNDFWRDYRNLIWVLKTMRIPCFMPAHVEADDTLAVLARKAVEQGYPVRILTSDQDMLQLVNDKTDVQVLLQSASASQAAAFGGNRIGPFTAMTEKDVLHKHKVPASLFVDYRALTGDSSDRMPGVKGIGPSNAEKLVNKYGTVPQILQALDKGEITGKAAKCLAAGRRMAYVARLLSEVLTRVPEDFSRHEDMFSAKGFMYEEVLPLLSELSMEKEVRVLKSAEWEVLLGGRAKDPLPEDHIREALEYIKAPYVHESEATASHD